MSAKADIMCCSDNETSFDSCSDSSVHHGC